MKVYIAVADVYAHLMEEYCYLFNLYWPSAEPVILGYDTDLLAKLPDNFEIVSLGEQTKSWCDPLRKYLEEHAPDYFVLTLEDHFISDYVDVDKVAMMEKEVKEGNCVRAMLHAHLNTPQDTFYKKGLRIIKPNREFRINIAFSIWNKEYLLRYMEPGFSLIQFEQANHIKAMNDGETIISVDTDVIYDHIVKYVNIYRSGKVDFKEGGPFGHLYSNDIVRAAALRAIDLKPDVRQEVLRKNHAI